jgi:hypothetical protein
MMARRVVCRLRRGLSLVLPLACVAVVCSSVVPAAARAAFGVVPGSFRVVTSSDRAGADPDLTTTFAIPQNAEGFPAGSLRSAEAVYPLGFAGYPARVKTCTPVQLQFEECPVGSQVGTLEAAVKEPFPGRYLVLRGGMYNIAPSANQTAVYGFALHAGGRGSVIEVAGEILVSVSPDYRVRARATNIFNPFPLVWQSITVWGVPADPSHDAQRGSEYGCRQSGLNDRFVAAEAECFGGGFSANENAVPYLVNPTQCTGKPLQAELVGVESWEGEAAERQTSEVGPFTNCSSLNFFPTIGVAPEQAQASSPAGYEVRLDVPQSEGAEGFATPDLKDAVVKLPAGVVLSPSAATGLETCSEGQAGLGSEQPVECPNGSKLGSVSVVTPALTHELKGFLFLGGPPSGPITGPPFTVYLTAEGNGVHLKIRGTATPDPVTGQVTTVFDENPELPFSELKLHLTGGSRATLANPSACGAYHAEADFTPWSSPFIADALTQSTPFEITGCGAPRFAPAFTAGTISNQAGGYSPMRVTFGRQDADQQLGGLSVAFPPGVSGNLSKVPLCPEPEAAQGTCPETSRIGEVTAAAGPGPEPVYTTAGKVFLTGPYAGAPFGLTIDASEHAGPFDLGSGACDCEVVRAAVNVDPRTAQLTVVSGALPTMKDGIPLQVKLVNVDVNRPEFVFNPTSCDPMGIVGALSSTQGANVAVSSHFQVTNCAALKFQPSFKVVTSGKTSKQNGANLNVKLTFPSTPQGTEANIRKVKVELPKQLPSRLTTLQQACLAKTFEANPASCPAASVVGYAKAITPILPVPLTGPAYFVSHGGEAFPDLVIVLQGYGVTIELTGNTFISKSGITSSTFNTVPDVPVGSFELYLPQGRFSALAANTNLCSLATTKTVARRVKVHGRTRMVTRKVQVASLGSLSMPTEFVSQDNTVIHQSTPIAVTGCPKAKSAKDVKKAKQARKAGGAR